VKFYHLCIMVAQVEGALRVHSIYRWQAFKKKDAVPMPYGLISAIAERIDSPDTPITIHSLSKLVKWNGIKKIIWRDVTVAQEEDSGRVGVAFTTPGENFSKMIGRAIALIDLDRESFGDGLKGLKRSVSAALSGRDLPPST
jgi:hypothetical protein